MISSLYLYSIALITNILVHIFGRKGSYSSIDFCELKFTSIGHIFYSMLRWISYLVAPITLLISCLFILHHLLRHWLYFTGNSNSFGSAIKVIIRNHRDFIIQPLVFTLCVMPYFLLGQVMICSKANSHFVGKLTTILMLLSNSALLTTFFITVSPSKLYMQEFWNESYVGRFLLYIKDRSRTGPVGKVSVSSISPDVFDTVI